MGVLYHINPYTGVPGICHAKNGQCPYGGTTGHENHYQTYEEAQVVADKMQADKFQQYQTLDGQDKVRDWSSTNRYSYLDKLSNEQALAEINDASDVNMLLAVIDGKVLVKPDNNPEFVKAALRNDNLPDDVMGELLENPEQFSQEALFAFEDNDMLTSAGRIELVKAYPHDMDYATHILWHKGISSDAIREALDDLKGDNDENYPVSVAKLVYNKNCPKDVHDEWLSDPMLQKLAI